MDRSGKEHLSDLQIALLLAGQGSQALRQALSEHLAVCADCRDLLAQSAIAHRADSQGSEARVGPENVRNDGSLLQQLFERLEATVPEIVAVPAARWTVSLRPFSIASEEGLALAAKPSVSPQFPVLTSDDGTIVVRFRRPAPDKPLRAYVVRKAPAVPGHMRIVFGEGERSFLVDRGGEADLPGVTEDDLRKVRIRIELGVVADGQSA